MRKKVWFGTRENMQWVPAPLTGQGYSDIFWRSSGTFLNGGGYQIQSGSSHKEPTLSWPVQALENIDKIIQAFNSGEMIYYIDPIAAKYNILPSYVSQYRKENPRNVSSQITGSVSSQGYPGIASKYLGTQEIATIPVPPDHNLWVGVHGSSSGGSTVKVQGDGSGSPQIMSTRQNLIQNGRARYTSGTVEVRRNLILNPLGDSSTGTTGYSTANDATMTFATGGGARIAALAGGTSASGVGFRSAFASLTVGQTYTLSLDVVGEVEDSWRLSIQGGLTASVINMTPVVVPVGETRRLSVTFTAAIATGGAVYVLRSTSSVASQAVVRKFLLEQSPVLGDYFDGSYSPDPDLTPSWTGTANASASVLTGTLAASFLTNFPERAFRIVSSQWPNGGYSIRVTPSGNSNNSYVESGVIFTTPGKIYGVAGIVHLDAALSGSLSPFSLKFWIISGAGNPTVTYFSSPTNAPGDYLVMGTFIANGTAPTVRFMNGSSNPGEDVFWTDMRVSDGYDTEAEALAAVQTYFDGDTPDTQDGFIMTDYSWASGSGPSASTETVTYDPNATVTVPVLSVTDSQRVNTKIQGGQFLTISTDGPGQVLINGAIAQILPSGDTPSPGGFISGQGYSGLRLKSDPMITEYSSEIPNAQIGISADFIETGSWE